MKIAFITEGHFTGKIPRTFHNMRTDLAWICSLEAEHLSIKSLSSLENKAYDVGIFILPKNLELVVGYLDDINLKDKFKTIAFLQEGPHTYFQNYMLRLQFWFYNFIEEVDLIFAHNEIDKVYYQGLFPDKPVYCMPSLMIEDPIKDIKIKTYEEREDIPVIGGTFTEWYSGFDSYIVALELNRDKIVSPSMGRSAKEEDLVVTKLPYSQWSEWIEELNKYRYGVHLMRTYAAGTFALNCSYLGIPCIGYEHLDTQRILHPTLTVKEGDILSAKKLASKLKQDKEFYLESSNMTRELFYKFYSEDIFLRRLYKILNFSNHKTYNFFSE